MQKTNEKDRTLVYRLNWRGVAYSFYPLLYADSNTPGCLLIPLLVLLFLPRLLLSYLEVSPQGLELLFWPTFRIPVCWDEVERLGKCTFWGKITCDALYLKNPSRPKSETIIDRERGLLQKQIIPLSDFRGWPEGGLAENLQRYCPRLFT